jgi:cytochrome c oxidase cbb3-type subunit 3
MRRIAIVLIPGLAALFAAAASVPDPASAGPADVSFLNTQASGKTLFEGKGNCHACHGKDSTGTPLAPDLTDTTWIQFDGRPTLEQVEKLIKDGVAQPKSHPAPMPAMGGASLSDEEIAQLAQYVLSLSADEQGSGTEGAGGHERTMTNVR